MSIVPTTSQFNGYFITSVVNSIEEGDALNTTLPSVILTITPYSGYTVTAGDFSASNLPTEVAAATFTQDGDNVLCTVTFNSGHAMPSLDTSLGLCIAGSAVREAYSISGVFDINGSEGTGYQSNASPGYITASPYSGSGYSGTTGKLLIKTFTADTGYYFETFPSVTLVNGEEKSYSFQIDPVYTNGVVTEVSITVMYTYPSENVQSNSLSFAATAVAIPSTAVEITGYSMDTTTSLPWTGDSRDITMYGTPGAAWSLAVVEGTNNSTIYNLAGTIQTNGYQTKTIVFPDNSSGETYTTTISAGSGTTLGTGMGTNPFQISQLSQASKGVEFSIYSGGVAGNSVIDLDHNGDGTTPDVVTVAVSPSDVSGTNTKTGSVTLYADIATADAKQFEKLQGIDISQENFTNTSGGGNGGTNVSLSNFSITGWDTNALAIQFDYEISTLGEYDVECQLLLHQILKLSFLNLTIKFVNSSATEAYNLPGDIVIPVTASSTTDYDTSVLGITTGSGIELDTSKTISTSDISITSGSGITISYTTNPSLTYSTDEKTVDIEWDMAIAGSSSPSNTVAEIDLGDVLDYKPGSTLPAKININMSSIGPSGNETITQISPVALIENTGAGNTLVSFRVNAQSGTTFGGANNQGSDYSITATMGAGATSKFSTPGAAFSAYNLGFNQDWYEASFLLQWSSAIASTDVINIDIDCELENPI